MKFSFNFRNKMISLDVKEEKGLMRGVGLIFRTKETNNLLFRFSPADKTAITSLLVFFPFIAIWLDKNKRVVDYKLIRPFQVSITPKKNASYLVELPINSRNSGIFRKIGFSVDKQRFK